MSPDGVLSADKGVIKCGGAVLRPVAAWTPSVHALLGHLAAAAFPAPRVLSSADPTMDALAYIEGEQVHPHAWRDEALVAMGHMVARLHAVAASFLPDARAVWQPWYMRELGDCTLISHGDIAPWNVITKNGMPMALIDWECAGPIDPLYELARVCWLFAQLFDDDIAAMHALPSAAKRAAQVRMLVDAYGLTAPQRRGFVDRLIACVVCETAHEAIDPGIRPEDAGPLWGFAWRTRSLYWIWRNKRTLTHALER